MQSLEHTLREYDPTLLGVIADRWDVDLESHSVTDIVGALSEAMLDEEAAAATWDRLDDTQRGAMQMLLGSGGVMTAAKFTRLFGEIREMGPARLEREKPYLEPVSVAEALFYRGLIARGFDEAASGPQAVIYVPTDLAGVLPIHHTGFDLSGAEGDELPPEDEEEDASAEQPEEVAPADTTLVDDMATLLAYVQVAAVEAREDGALSPAHEEALMPFLLGQQAERLALLVGLARSLGLIAPREGLLRPVSHNARRWLEAPRSEQVRTLAVGWRESVDYNELWHTPGLVVEAANNDPRLARQAVLRHLGELPQDSWWVVEALIEAIKEEDPDFQRPGGDYESWYIREARQEGYLRGFESWDAVEGATLRFILLGPLHWLGLADVGRHAGQELGRLNAYGRAFVAGAEAGEWPSRPEAEEPLALHEDGVAEASRRMSRYDRFQLARFTEWLAAGEVYRYRLSLRGLRRAARQGIRGEHIRAFLARTAGSERLPGGVEALLSRWGQSGEADATIEQLTVLRTASAQALEAILAEPALRRYLGARLGPEAVIVRPGQAAALQDALAERGLLADWVEAAGGDPA